MIRARITCFELLALCGGFVLYGQTEDRRGTYTAPAVFRSPAQTWNALDETSKEQRVRGFIDGMDAALYLLGNGPGITDSTRGQIKRVFDQNVFPLPSVYEIVPWIDAVYEDQSNDHCAFAEVVMSIIMRARTEHDSILDPASRQ